MAKKTAAQIKRLIKRAEERGEIYIPPSSLSSKDDEGMNLETNGTKESSTKSIVEEDVSSTIATDKELLPSSSVDNVSSESAVKLNAFRQYQMDLESIDANNELKAKERRSAKRKADAIAMESSNCTTIEDLVQWYETTGKILHDDEMEQNRFTAANLNVEKEKATNVKSSDGTTAVTKKTSPYILFIGQLSYDTTKEDLFEHIKTKLVDEHKVTAQNLRVRMLQDIKTKKSRGMAFVEIVSDDPEFMYSCLKLHRTYLKGRRINVERSAGGGVQTRANKIQQHRAEQERYIDTTVNSMLEEYYVRGEIQRSGELDDGVVQLCKRHSTTVVQASLERYVESNGRDMDNSSAYLSFLLTKLAEEGIYTNRDDNNDSSKKDTSKRSKSGNITSKRPSNQWSKEREPDGKRFKLSTTNTNSNRRTTTFQNNNESSEFAKQGIDMSVSSNSNEGKAAMLQKIFPSLSRGRGRGRGYM